MAETKTTTSPRTSTATARRKTAATRRSTTAKKAATTRATRQATANVEAATRNPVKQVQGIAQRAVLVQVGAALEARDRVVDTVGSLTETATSRPAAERQLKKFERRGATELRKTRTRVQRELRQRRTRLERTVKRNRTRLGREVKSARRDVEKQGRELQKNLTANFDRVAAEAQNRFQGGAKSTAKLASEATERVNAAS
jgi:DNA-binding transcriptional ArsR family regulator